MKNYWILYKPFLQFIAAFLAAFVLLTLVYQMYLSQYKNNQADGITLLVANHTAQVLHFLEQDSAVIFQENEPIIIQLHQKTVALIIEGCNAVSVIILFISFVVAFSGKIKTTLLFLVAGSGFIYGLNILRIAALSILLYRFPERESILHGVIFPLFIYGVVFILWFIWVIFFSKYAKNPSSK